MNLSILKERKAMPGNPNYPNYPPYRPALEPDELDDVTLDGVVGGLISPAQVQESQMSFNLQYLQLQSQMQNENRSYAAISKVIKQKP